ncbi:interferon gamma receptor 2 [Acomys russatus]|uniref:interferon gamma receptor 2 n=1 Tax=Acomys russatus TaxID=60746 RepID=UPI0021E2D55F|nr:interferon gamma receptor 2 [Acomys russatus]
MRPPPPWLLSLLLCSLGVAAPSPDPSSQLAAPLNMNIYSVNDKQILTWEPPPPSNDTSPVVYQVEYCYIGGSWHTFQKVNCTDITETNCDFTEDNFPRANKIFLRVRAKQGEHTSDWVRVGPYEYYREVIVGPPRSIAVAPGEDSSLIINFTPPFHVIGETVFRYRVRYWEKTGSQQARMLFSFVKGPFLNNFTVLGNLKPFTVYCLQVEAQLVLQDKSVRPPGISNVSCHETTAGASTRRQQVILIPFGIFMLLLVLTVACFFLFLKHRSRVKYWFQAPPRIPEQIREYLKDPDQFILEDLDKDSSPKDDAWDSVSVVFFPEKEQDDVLQTL